eukprot:TRINITY_DN10015_c0_g1_i1.p3 TRINITY_DN10015_c0_g1~~TRINITY_DN10015_c0_g1_i1.p3  ORF type:complete len:210 (-),score=57.03 TRINITY_DN10015_c0_g1_i1:1477-2106(-)
MSNALVRLAVIVLSIAVFCCAEDLANKKYRLEGKISPPPRNGKTSFENSQTNVLFVGDYEQYYMPVRKDGSFVFHDIPAGNFLLQVVSSDHVYDNVRIEITSVNNGQIKAVNVHDDAVLAYPLRLEPKAPISYFAVREGFDLVGILFKNPMILMLAFTLLITFVFPKIAANIDPEELRQLQNPGGNSPAPVEEPPVVWSIVPLRRRDRD